MIPMLLVAFIALFGQGTALSDDLLYAYGEDEGDQTTPISDDGCSPQQQLRGEFKFFGTSYKNLYVCNNGVVSFNTPVPQYTSAAFPLTGGQAFITPFWADVNNVLGGSVLYRETQDAGLLQRITDDMDKYLPDLHFTATWAYIATWYDVCCFGVAVTKRNTFQTALISDGNRCYIIMNYKNIDWTTGTESGGDPETGLGGTPAQAGFNSGDETNYFSIPGSRTDEVVNLPSTSNVNYPGRWIFRADEFEALGGCTYQAKFAREGEPFWEDSTCSKKCFCQSNEVTCVTQGCPPYSTCEVSESFYTCKGQEQEPERTYY